MVLRSKCSYLIALVALLTVPVALGESSTTSPDVQVQLDNQEALTLRVTIRSRADTPVLFNKALLPWGNRNSLILHAVTPDGRCLQQFFAIDDPSFETVTVAPRVSLAGEVKLADYFKDLGNATKKSEIQLFWAYKAPRELRIDTWSGGWILIPQQK